MAIFPFCQKSAQIDLWACGAPREAKCAQNIFLMVWAFFSRNFGLESVFSRKTGIWPKIDLLRPTFGGLSPGPGSPKVGPRRSILSFFPVFREKTRSRPKFREKNAQTINKMFWARKVPFLGPLPNGHFLPTDALQSQNRHFWMPIARLSDERLSWKLNVGAL